MINNVRTGGDVQAAHEPNPQSIVAILFTPTMNNIMYCYVVQQYVFALRLSIADIDVQCVAREHPIRAPRRLTKTKQERNEMKNQLQIT